MAAFNFPPSPSNGDTYTLNSVTYQYDGTKWVRYSASVGAQGATGAAGSNASISSNADNRVITGGSGTNLVGEANLTFDGATLTAHMSSATPAVIVGDSNRTGAGQHLAEFRGYWDGNHVARIVYAAGDDTTNKDDGVITMHTTPSGGGITERLRINSYGQVGINTTSGGQLAIAMDSSNTNPLATGFIALSLKNTNTTDNTSVCMDFNNSVGGIVGRFGAQFKDTSDKDTDLYFATRADGGSLAEALRITSDGNVMVGNGVDTPYAPLHVYAENGRGLNAIFGKGFVDSANYHYDDANIQLNGRDVDGNDTGSGIEFNSRNTGNSNWLHGAITQDRSGNLNFINGGAGTAVGTAKLIIAAVSYTHLTLPTTPYV